MVRVRVPQPVDRVNLIKSVKWPAAKWSIVDLWLDLKLEMLTCNLTWTEKNLLGPSCLLVWSVMRFIVNAGLTFPFVGCFMRPSSFAWKILYDVEDLQPRGYGANFNSYWLNWRGFFCHFTTGATIKARLCYARFLDSAGSALALGSWN